ncbi:Ig-like domain-containing protein, partial [Sinomicrobium sp. M5D2P9]
MYKNITNYMAVRLFHMAKTKCFFARIFLIPMLLLTVFGVKTAQAQTTITFDTEYWLALPTTDVRYRAGSAFRISTFDQAATVTVSAPLIAGFLPKTVTVGPNSTGSILLTDDEVAQLTNDGGNTVSPTGIRIETNERISIYYEPGAQSASPDLVPLKGSQALGTEFLVPMQQETPLQGKQGFLVLATEDNTTVTITPKIAVTGHEAGVPFTVTLQRGEIYFAEMPGNDPGTSGSIVNADKLVAVTIFSELTRYGVAADLCAEQIVPIKNLGTEYLIVRGYRTTSDVVYFTAVEDGTQLTINGAVAATLNAAETYTLRTNAADTFHVQSSKKVTALQLSGVFDEQGISLLPAQLGCNGSNVVKVVRVNPTEFFVNIVSPTNTGFTVNGNATLLASSAFQQIPGTSWYYARVEVPNTLVAAGDVVDVSNSSPDVRFHMGAFHSNGGGARFGYFSSYVGTVLNFAEAEKEVCVGQSVSFTPQIVSSDPITAYTWLDSNDSIVSNEEVLTLENVTEADSGTYTLRIGGGDCTVEESVQLTVHETTGNLPVIGFQDPLATCIPNAVLEVTNPDPDWVSYQWYMDGVLIPEANDTSYQPTAGQVGEFTVNAVLASGCSTPLSAGTTLASNCPVPFECDGSAYLISSPSGTVPSSLYVVEANNPTIVHATIIPTIDDRYNGIGYNFEDNLIYGFAQGDPPSLNLADVVRIDAEGTVTRLGVPQPTPGQVPGLPTWTANANVNANGGRVNHAAGVVGLDHKLYTLVLTNNNTAFLATVDLITMTYTTVRLSLDIGNMVDLAFSPYNGFLYGLSGGRLIRINPNNGNQAIINPSSGTIPANLAAGGAWNDVQGRIYFYANGTTPNRLYRYNPANNVFVNVSAVDPYPTFDATACFPTRLEKQVIMPAEGLVPGDEVEFEFSIYNSQMLPMTYDFEDVLASPDLTWVEGSVEPAGPGGGTVSFSGQTLTISGVTVQPSAATGEPLTFRVSVRVADNASYGSCYSNQATITQGGTTVVSDDPTTPEHNDPTLFCLNECELPAPASGGNIQECAIDPVQKITATATVPDGVQLIWYDAPAGGNVVTDPSLETVGTVTYYAAADDGTCISQNRTPVTLNILPTPLLDEIEDVEECVSYELPEITGSNLTGNEAYYTEPNGGGTKYLPGDVIEDIGITTLYVYDELEAVNNCEGNLTVSSNTAYVIDNLFEDGTHHQYPGATNPGFWQGTANQQILYNSPGAPVGDQIYLGVVGDVSIDDTTACFGTEVSINAQVAITNQGPGNGAGYSGRLAIINKSTDQILYQTQLTANFPAGATMTPTVTGVVPAADVLAGNIAIIVAVETFQGTYKNWQLSGFSAGYQFQPESTRACSDEQSFELMINDLPELVITDPEPECLPGTVDLTDAAVTAGSTAGLIYSYFEDAEGTMALSGPESVSVTGTYYIRGEDPATGCSTIMPVEAILIDAPEVSIGQPVCIDGEGSIEVTYPLGAEFEYSIDGSDYQSAAVFESVAPGTYMVTVRNTITGCISLETEAVVDDAPGAPIPTVTQPDCESPTGTIHIPRYENALYSIDGGVNFSGLNTFSELEPGDYVVVIRDAGCDSDPVTVTIEEAPLVPAAPISGGDQVVCAENPVQTLTATASVEAGETIVWYDAPVGGNLVADPSLNTIGVVTYYAEANNSTCPSLNRTAVTLMIQQAPHLDPMEDQEACEEYILPEIEGLDLSGNEAYFTEPNGGGTRLEPGDTINTIGTTTLYVYDEIEGEFNCSGVLSAVSSTKVTQSGLEAMWGGPTVYLTDDYDSAVWNSNSTTISYDTSDPIINNQTYKTIAADVVFAGEPGCFGSSIRVNPRVRITNTGPDTGRAYSGEVAMVNNATNEIIARSQQLLWTPVNDPVDIDFTTAVSIEDLTGGNISVVIIVETYHGDDFIKDWTIENFSVDYQYLPEFTPTCPDEQSFELTIYETPVANAGEEQTQYNSNIFTLDAIVPAAGTGEWSVVDGTLAEAISDINDSGATVALDPNTSVTLRWTVTNGTCSAFDDVVLNYVSQADIVTVKVTSDAGQTEYVPGETVEYTITVTNNGPSDAEQVNIVDVDPAGAEIAGWTAEVVAGTVTLPNTSGTGSIDEIIDLLPAGAEVRYNITVQTFPHSVEELVNAVQVTSPTEDPDPDCPDCETPPLEPNPQADIVTVKVTSNAGQTEFVPGESVEYTITVTNNGPSDAQQVNVVDTAPAGTMITNWTAEVTTGTVTLPNTNGTDDINETISTFPNGATVTYTVTVQIPPDFTDDLVNAVQVTSPTEDPDPDCPDCETPPLEPNPQADIVTVKVTSNAGQTEFVPGESVEYTITVTNNGPSDAEQVNVVDTAPAGTTITNWTAEVTTGTVTLPNTSGTDDINETIS